MADDNNQDNKPLGLFNTIISSVAAVLGLIISWQTISLNNEIDRLNENIEASSLIGDLIGSLTSDAAKQDIALLALDNALSSDSDESRDAREERHKELVAKIASNLLNRSLSVTEGEDGASLSRQVREETRTARDILKKLLADQSSDYQAIVDDDRTLEYQRIAAVALMDYEDRANASKAPTDTAQVQVQYDETSAADPDEVIRAEVTAEAQSDLQQEQQILELATAAEAVSGVAEDAKNDKVAYLHYDELSLEAGMQQLKGRLETSGWFVTNAIELIEPDAFNCSVSSDIRFFHDDDEALARELREQVSAAAITAIAPHVSTVRLIDLSNWEKASLVPKRQLELWIVANGDDCATNRRSN